MNRDQTLAGIARDLLKALDLPNTRRDLPELIALAARIGLGRAYDAGYDDGQAEPLPTTTDDEPADPIQTRDEVLAEIGQVVLHLETLDTRNDGKLDYQTQFVGDLREALELAYDNGYTAADETARRPVPTDPDTAAAAPDATIVAHHRNGIAGAPFHVVLFTDGGENGGRKLAVVFAAKHHVAVFDVAKLAAGDIAFGSNSWRGDQFERMLRTSIDQHHKADICLV